MCHIAM